MSNNLYFAEIIRTCHILLIVFVAITPFIQNTPLIGVLLHFVTCISLLIHWALNDDTCFLTYVESSLRGLKTVNESYFHQLVSPVYKYKIDEPVLNDIIRYTTLILGIMSGIKLFSALRPYYLSGDLKGSLSLFYPGQVR